MGPGHRPDAPAPAGNLYVWDTPLAAPVVAGQLDRSNADYVLRTLTCAGQGCIDGTFAGMITAPVHNGVINEAGIPSPAIPEFLAELTATEQVVMMLAHPRPARGPSHHHLPLRDVADAITAERLARQPHPACRPGGEVRHAAPRILVCGPQPARRRRWPSGPRGKSRDRADPGALRGEGLNLIGPLPADTPVHPQAPDHCDAVLAMYHDQGLPVLGHKGLRRGGQCHLGLPIIRTSVDHGTALDLAGSGRWIPAACRSP